MEIRAPALDKLVFMKLILKKIIALDRKEPKFHGKLIRDAFFHQSKMGTLVLFQCARLHVKKVYLQRAELFSRDVSFLSDKLFGARSDWSD